MTTRSARSTLSALGLGLALTLTGCGDSDEENRAICEDYDAVYADRGEAIAEVGEQTGSSQGNPESIAVDEETITAIEELAGTEGIDSELQASMESAVEALQERIDNGGRDPDGEITDASLRAVMDTCGQFYG